MNKPYATNTNCHYKPGIPLSNAERKQIRTWNLFTVIPILVFSCGGLLLMINMFFKSEETFVWQNGIIAVVLLLIIGLAIRALFKKYETKETFESEATYYFGVFYVKEISFRDSVIKMKPIPFSCKVKNIKIGNRYKVHKLSDRNIILKIEEIRG